MSSEQQYNSQLPDNPLILVDSMANIALSDSVESRNSSEDNNVDQNIQSANTTVETPTHAINHTIVPHISAEGSSKYQEITRDPFIPLQQNSLQKLPTELRQKIFEITGSCPYMLQAFVGNQPIYEDILKEYWKAIRCNIPYGWRFWRDCSLSQRSLNSIRKVQILYIAHNESDGLKTNGWRSTAIDGWRGWNDHTPPMRELIHLSNLSDIRIKFTSIISPLVRYHAARTDSTPQPWQFHSGTAICRVRDCIAAFSSCKTGLQTVSCEFDQKQANELHEQIDVLNEVLGVPARLESVDTGTGTVIYFWEHADKRRLSWIGRTAATWWAFPGSMRLNHTRFFPLEGSPYFQRL